MSKISENNNTYKFILLHHDLKSIYEKHKEQIEQLKDYIIVRDFKKIPQNIIDKGNELDFIYKICRKKKKQQLQVIIQGQLITLSQKMFMTLYALLYLGEIYESEYNCLNFRPKACATAGKKKSRNIVKSIMDLKIALKPYFSPNYSEDEYKKEFLKIAYEDEFHGERIYKTSCKKCPIPDFILKERVQKRQLL